MLELKTVETQHGKVRYIEGGIGSELVFLHGANGVTPADPFLLALARTHHVYAPLLPGYGDSEEAPELRDMLDFTLHTWDVLDALKCSDPILVGHSMGGMIAAEMAAVQPNDVSRLALISAGGLWDDEHPIGDIFAAMPYEMPALLFNDPVAGEAMLTAGRDVEDPNFLQQFLVANARQLGMAGRILFPIPERGLANRLYRIRARTIVIWGDNDRLIPPFYAQAFKKGIKDAQLVSIPEAGHMVILEKPEAVADAVSRLG